MSLRPALAAIQRLQPGSFAQLVNEGAATQTVAEASALNAPLFGVVRVGELLLAISAAPPAEGVLAGQVAIVSGAASGLGLGVATGLYRAGACVLFTDVDAAGLQAVAARFADPARVHTATIDVTNEASVAAGFDAALARWGRVDCIACCAGVAPAYALEDFPLDKWELSLRINLTGYFLFGREAARIMKAQGHGGSMVLLSSKSGLEPSKANTAYNATKSGELHMARGWALELGRDAIRVNCIAPGNVFEGSKIWNKEYIAAAAKKKGIAPEQVIPYYIGLTALNRDIKPDDIANAAVFLASDASRCVTGQVLVVDGGQVFTR
jgi:NAD(P)-dependent dehydrogenase (short-subunit alcohol dehydrogenase family)